MCQNSFAISYQSDKASFLLINCNTVCDKYHDGTNYEEVVLGDPLCFLLPTVYSIKPDI